MDHIFKGTPNPLNPGAETGPIIEPRSAKPASTGPMPTQPTVPTRPTGMPGSAKSMDMMRPRPAQRPTMSPSMQPIQPTGAATMPPAPASRPTPRPVAPNNLGVVTNVSSPTPGMNVDPLNRPMQKEVAPEVVNSKKNRKKTKLIIAMFVSLFIAIACGVAALIVMLNTPKTDMVAIAVNRLVSGQASDNIMVDGTITAKFRGNNSDISSLDISLGTEARLSSLINSTMAKLKVNLKNGESFSMDVGEVYAVSGDLYIKVAGIKDALANTKILDQETLSSLSNLVEVIDGTWLKIPVNDLQNVLPEKITKDSTYTCLTGLIGSVTSNNSLISSAYLKNPFIISTDEDLSVTSERDPIYKVLIDDQKFRSFLDETTNSELVKGFASCMHYTENANVRDKLASAVKDLPDLYVEVNNGAEITRLYTTTEVDNGNVLITADLQFSYPTNVNIPAPTEYKDIKDLTF